MVNVIVLTHGALAESLMETLQLFFSEPEGMLAMGLGEEPEKMRQFLQKELLDSNEREFLVLVDLFGGTPFNITASVLSEAIRRGKRVEVVTGVNLPMLMQVACDIEEASLDELKASALESGTTGIQDLMARLAGQNQE